MIAASPGPYWRLAALYRKAKRFHDEIKILERFERQRHAPGALPAHLLKQLRKARLRTL